MTIPAINSIIPANLTQPLQSTAKVADAPGGGDFGQWLGQALDTVSASQTKADGLAVQAATGDLTAIHDYTIASTEAQILTQLTVEVRNRALEAFNDIMRMQV